MPIDPKPDHAPTLEQFKNRARIELTDTDQDADMEAMLAEAIAIMETAVGVPIDPAYVLDDDEHWQPVMETVFDRTSHRTMRCQRLILPKLVAVVDTVTGVTHEVDEAHYSVEDGIIVANPDRAFCDGPYTVVGIFALAYMAAWDGRLGALMRAAVLDTAMERWEQRTPNVQSENSGGGVSVQFKADQASAVDAITPAVLSRAERIIALISPVWM